MFMFTRTELLTRAGPIFVIHSQSSNTPEQLPQLVRGGVALKAARIGKPLLAEVFRDFGIIGKPEHPFRNGIDIVRVDIEAGVSADFRHATRV